MEPSRTPMDSPFTGRSARMAAAQGPTRCSSPCSAAARPACSPRGAGLPTFGIPLGNPDQANHAPDENLDLDRSTPASRRPRVL